MTIRVAPHAGRERFEETSSGNEIERPTDEAKDRPDKGPGDPICVR